MFDTVKSIFGYETQNQAELDKQARIRCYDYLQEAVDYSKTNESTPPSFIPSIATYLADHSVPDEDFWDTWDKYKKDVLTYLTGREEIAGDVLESSLPRKWNELEANRYPSSTAPALEIKRRQSSFANTRVRLA